MINEKKELKLVDFGVSKYLPTLSTECLTPTGTPSYKAPEIWNTGDPYSYNVDCWASGIVLYEMLVGVKPFKTTKKFFFLLLNIINYFYLIF